MNLQSFLQAQDIVWGEGKVKLPATFGKTGNSGVTGKTELLILFDLVEVIRQPFLPALLLTRPEAEDRAGDKDG